MTAQQPSSSPAPAPRRPRGLAITTAVLALALIVSLSFNILHLTSPGGPSTNRSFSSPKEAAEFYVTALSKGQVKELAEAHVSSTLIEHYDVKAEIKQIRMIHLNNLHLPIPLQGEITTGMWTEQFRSTATATISSQIGMLTATEPLDLRDPIKVEPQEIEETFARFDATRLEGLRITQLRVAHIGTQQIGPRQNGGLTYLQEVFSPQEVSDVLVELSSGHLLVVTLFRYDNRWYLAPTMSPLVSVSIDIPYHKVIPLSSDDAEFSFAELISELEQEGVVFE